MSYLPASQSGHHVLLSPDDRKEILAATSFSHIFVVLNQYWSSHQYELLEYVVKEYGDDGLKEEMKVYVAEMDELEKEEDISNFTGVRLCSPRPDSVTMEVHLSGSQHTLQNSRHVQRSMASQCGLHPHTVRTSHSTAGSTALTLLVPYSVAGHVLAVLRGMPLAGDLLSRPVEERVVYTMDEAETEMYLPLVINVKFCCMRKGLILSLLIHSMFQNLQPQQYSQVEYCYNRHYSFTIMLMIIISFREEREKRVRGFIMHNLYWI